MDRLIYQALSGLNSSLNSLKVASNNVANANSVGFKEQLVNTISTKQQHNALYDTRAYATTSTSLNTTQHMVYTGNVTDIAIKDGFLKIKDAQNNIKYISTASVKINIDNQLTTQNNDLVLDESDNPIELNDIKDLTKTEIPIFKGSISNNDFNGGYQLTTPEVDETNKLLFGYKEESNVDLNKNLLNIIEAQQKFNLNMQLLNVEKENSNKRLQILEKG